MRSRTSHFLESIALGFREQPRGSLCYIRVVEGPSLADPLLIFEQAEPPARPLPAVFAPCGSKDPVLDDSVRLGKAVQRFDIPSAAPVYDGGNHSFQAVTWNELARRYWRDTASFLAEQGLVDAGRIDELVPLS